MDQLPARKAARKRWIAWAPNTVKKVAVPVQRRQRASLPSSARARSPLESPTAYSGKHRFKTTQGKRPPRADRHGAEGPLAGGETSAGRSSPSISPGAESFHQQRPTQQGGPTGSSQRRGCMRRGCRFAQCGSRVRAHQGHRAQHAQARGQSRGPGQSSSVAPEAAPGADRNTRACVAWRCGVHWLCARGAATAAGAGRPAAGACTASRPVFGRGAGWARSCSRTARTATATACQWASFCRHARP